MIRVGLTLLGRGLWTGGEVYLRNMLTMMASRLAADVHPILFVTPAEAAKIGTSFDTLLPQPPVVDEAVANIGRGSGLRRALAGGCDTVAAQLFGARGCDVVFESALFFGWRFPLPTVAWMPDFQHKFMPEMFTRAGWWRREIGFRAQIATNRIVMLSSETAEADAKRFYPGIEGRTAVVRFAQMIDPAAYHGQGDRLRATYDLPQSFVFLPNQFWRHKNHALIIAALEDAKHRGMLDRMPLVVMSGRQDDARDPGVYKRFEDRLATAGVAQYVRHLGLIPYNDVLALIATADAMLNPSYFEGWSTPVEEAKALGARLLLSDIRIHREQAPDAHFFGVEDASALADTLCAATAPRATLDMAILAQQQDARIDAYAAALLDALRRAAALRKQRA
jgi:glycosyltransferase involved in cell wall biosynthesis